MISPLSSSEYSKAIYSSQSLISQSASDISSPNAGKAQNDTVTISEQGKTASLLNSISNSCNSPLTIDSIAQCLKNDTEYVEQQLRSIYSKLGLSSDTEMKMSVGRDGSIIVNGENSKADEIEDAINNDPELANTIRRMSANTSLLEAARRHQEFTNAYENDPDAALEEFAFLFEDGHEYHVSFTLSNGNISSEVANV